MAANHDVIDSSAVNAVTSLEGIYDQINLIGEVYRNNSRNFAATPMKLSEVSTFQYSAAKQFADVTVSSIILYAVMLYYSHIHYLQIRQ